MRGELVAGRYRVVSTIGAGMEATVFRADDIVGGGPVALKISAMKSATRHTRGLGEAAILRLLRVRGVAHMLDDGLHEGRAFHVTELVDGLPFPGKAAPLAWNALAPIAIALLDTLERVHGAGIVHADLKPANVLVASDGRPLILDFGASRRTAIDFGRGSGPAVSGALAFLAPEILRGSEPGVASDLYAVGTMLYLALTDTLPHPGSTPGTLLRARLAAPAASLPPECAPPHVVSAIAALLAAAPDARPASAAATRAALEDAANDWRVAEPSVLLANGDWNEAALRELFLGEERLFHLRTDAARILHRAGGGASTKMATILSQWAHAGIVRPSGSRFWIDRQSLADLREDEIAQMGGEGSLAERVLTTTLRAIETGDAIGAVSTLEVGARALRGCPVEMNALREEVFLTWLEIAISEQSAQAADRLAYEATQHGLASTVAARASTIARALVAFAGDPRRALEALRCMGQQESPRLERCRVSLAMVAARSIDLASEHALLAEAEAYGQTCGDPVFLARVDGWRGRLAYREGRYLEAADLHRRSAEQMTDRLDLILAHLNRAAALVEAFELDGARDVSETARRALGATRHPLFEARLEWLTRVCSYRYEEDLHPDVELVEASARLGVPHLEAQLAFLEAAFAWRKGELETALTLARRAERRWRQVDTLVDLAWCARALQLVCGNPCSSEVASEIAERACRSEIPGVGVQILGLLALGGHDPHAAHRAHVSRLAASVPLQFHNRRIDVLSVDEALHHLRASE